jgi:hypothetical protein
MMSMELNALTIEQDTDREIDSEYETGLLLAQERARSRPPKINALTWEQIYVEGKKPPVTFQKLWDESGYRSVSRSRATGPDDESRYSPIERYDRGEDQDDPGVKESQPVYDGRVSDLVTDGHGFTVRRFTTNPDLPEVCRYCGDRLLTEDERWPCEFDEPIGDTFTGNRRDSRPRQCQCNGCSARRAGRRYPGNQPEVCDAVECQKRMNRERQARHREKERAQGRLLAREWLTAYPEWTDKDLAAELNIPKPRVVEARAQLAGIA